MYFRHNPRQITREYLRDFHQNMRERLADLKHGFVTGMLRNERSFRERDERTRLYSTPQEMETNILREMQGKFRDDDATHLVAASRLEDLLAEITMKEADITLQAEMYPDTWGDLFDYWESLDKRGGREGGLRKQIHIFNTHLENQRDNLRKLKIKWNVKQNDANRRHNRSRSRSRSRSPAGDALPLLEFPFGDDRNDEIFVIERRVVE